MKEEISLHIPTPCNENWHEMTPTQQGRFCNACSKQVTDFTQMSDQQLLNFFKQKEAPVCGRFYQDQLTRSLQPVATEPRKSWWLALLMPMLLLFDKAGAQKKKQKLVNIETLRPENLKNDAPPAKERVTGNYENEYAVVGEVSLEANFADTSNPGEAALMAKVKKSAPNELLIMGDTLTGAKPVHIAGNVSDEHKQPVAYASVVIKETNKGTAADSAGNFSINTIVGDTDTIMLTVSFVGFETKEVPVKLPAQDTLPSVNIKLDPITCNAAMLGEVIVFTGFTVAKKYKKPKSDLLNIFKRNEQQQAFTAYPNPAQRGGIVSIRFNNQGNYTVHLTDNQGNTVAILEPGKENSITNTSLTIPPSIAQGIYYLQVTNTMTKKRFTEKIVVQ